jgi:hypothetical protein
MGKSLRNGGAGHRVTDAKWDNPWQKQMNMDGTAITQVRRTSGDEEAKK